MSDKPTDNTPNDNQNSLLPPSLQGVDVLELGHVDYSHYQLVRGEYYADNRNPYVTFYKGKFYCNAACLRLFPEAEYVEVLINDETRMLALRPCDPYTRDSFRWCKMHKGRRVVRQGLCKELFAGMMTMMNWNPTGKVSLLGQVARANGEFVLFFNLNSPKFFPTIVKEDGTTVLSREVVYREEWNGTFGMLYTEQQKYTRLLVLDGYAVVVAEDRKPDKKTEESNGGGSENGQALLGSNIDHRPEEEQVKGESGNTDSDRNT